MKLKDVIIEAAFQLRCWASIKDTGLYNTPGYAINAISGLEVREYSLEQLREVLQVANDAYYTSHNKFNSYQERQEAFHTLLLLLAEVAEAGEL